MIQFNKFNLVDAYHSQKIQKYNYLSYSQKDFIDLDLDVVEKLSDVINVSVCYDSLEVLGPHLYKIIGNNTKPLKSPRKTMPRYILK